METYNELKHLANRELDKVVDKGDLTPSEVECVYKMVKTLSMIDNMETGNDYSGKLQMYYSRDDYKQR